VVAGIRRHGPERRAPWLLVLAGQVLWAGAWVAWEIPIVLDGRTPGTGSLINLGFFAGNLFVAASLVAILWLRERDWVAVVGAFTVAASLAVVAWALLLHRYLDAAGVSWAGSAIHIAYGLSDVLLLAVLMRVLVAPLRRSAALVLLLVAPAALVVSDVLWNWLTLIGGYQPGSVGDVGWLAFAACTGVAALHPSMIHVFETTASRPRLLHGARMALLAAAVLVSPVTFAFEELIDDADAEPLVIGGGVIAALVLIGLVLVLRSQEASARRLAELAAVVESTEDAVIATDLLGTITGWNHGAELLYGHRAEEVVGRSVLLIIPPERRAFVAAHLAQAGAGERIERHDATGIRADGTLVDVALTVSPIRDPEGRVVGTATIARDISDRLAHEAELEEQNERLRELDRMKDDFVASVSHELRTPLTSIRGYLELLRDDLVLDDEQERMLAVVDRNAERLLSVVSDLLFVAQVEAGQLRIERGWIDLGEIAREAVDAARPRADHAGVTLALTAEDVVVDGDRTRVCQVLDNLISNAIKFTPGGGRVEVVVEESKRVAAIEVRDTGAGIPADELSELFQRFFRTRSATRAAVPGTGLGLAIVKAITEAHGGTVAVESRVGEGTTFRVELPLGVREPARA
jgi:PAS domain S-box-containing protein